MITIYSTPTCTYCDKAKALFKEHGAEYTEYNVKEDLEKRQEMIDKSGQMGVPVIIINDEVLVGFDREKLLSKIS